MDNNIRIGSGIDFHRFIENRELIIGGIKIPYHLGLKGHSDADVLLHAVCDALLGALCLGDIGIHFPDTADQYKNIDSKILLKRVYELIVNKNYVLNNLDCTIIAEKPKISEHINKMQKIIADILSSDISNISIKATTTEKMGFIGRKEGIGAFCSLILKKRRL